MHAYAAFYIKDAGYVIRARMLVSGCTEIEKLHAQAFVESLRNTKLALKARRIAFLTSASAVIYADVELKHAGDDRNLIRAITTFVVAKVDERLAGLRRAHRADLHRLMINIPSDSASARSTIRKQA